MKTGAILLALAAGAACGGGSETACGLGAMADTTGWQVIDAGPFVFKLPPGYRDEFALGTDSYAGTWTQGERSITFSWGPHTADPRLSPRGPGAAPPCETRIGGRAALVMEGRDRALGGGELYRVSGWWEKPDTLGANLYLGGAGPADDEAGRSVATTVIRTVRLRTAWSARDSLRMHHRVCEISRVYDERHRAEYPDAPVRVPSELDPRRCPAGPPPPPTDYESVR
ncbi:MAG TPA: hypothetical protein VLK84_32135 [Longimicrobium sp.]|nr:hypothetical protein [Longimicrobium sp.]